MIPTRNLIVLTVSIASSLSLFAVEQGSEKRPPNIVVILADDLGYGDLSCYNSESKVPTPHIDKLAGQGLKFTDAHSASTVCTPSRYSLLTGQMSFRIGKGGVFAGAGGPSLIAKDRLTLPQMLKNKGYTTAMYGKWHVGLTFLDNTGTPILESKRDAIQRIDYSRPIPDAPIHCGFDFFYGTACCPATDWLYAYIDGDRIPVPPTQPLDKKTIPVNPYTEDCRDGFIAPDFKLDECDTVFMQKSLQFLDEHKTKSPEKPFFLFLSTQGVHLPSLPSKAFQGKTKTGPHGDFIAEFDHNVGTLLAKLDELGVSKDTLVILTSDNGPEVDAIVNMRKDYQHDGARPWRGIKRDQWEGGHRVPFIVRWPALIPSGTSTSQLTCLTDVMATCASIVGAPLPNNAAEDSFDLSPVLKSPDSLAPIRDYILHQTWTLKLAVRKGNWKYLDHQGSGGNDYSKIKSLAPYVIEDTDPSAPGQLFDLSNDPKETKNLYSQHPEIVKELKGLLDKTKTEGRSAPIRSNSQ